METDHVLSTTMLKRWLSCIMRYKEIVSENFHTKSLIPFSCTLIMQLGMDVWVTVTITLRFSDRWYITLEGVIS